MDDIPGPKSPTSNPYPPAQAGTESGRAGGDGQIFALAMSTNFYIYWSLFLDVLKMIFNFVLGPPLPRGVPGEGPD